MFMTEINILGSCVLRDAFRIASEKKINDDSYYTINKFYQFSNPFVYTQKKPKYMLNIEDLAEFEVSNFFKKCVVGDYNKTNLHDICNDGNGWFLFDLAEFRFDVGKIQDRGEDIYVTFTNKFVEMYSYLYPDRDINDYVKKTDISIESCYEAIDILMELVLERYGQNVIMVNDYLSYQFYNNETNFYYTDNEAYSLKVNRFLSKLYNYVKNSYSTVKIVEMPKLLVGSLTHKWGKDRLHFLDDYYIYLYRQIDSIIRYSKNHYTKEETDAYFSNLYKGVIQSAQLEVLKKERSRRVIEKNNLSEWNVIKSNKNFFDKDNCILHCYDGYIILYKDVKIDLDNTYSGNITFSVVATTLATDVTNLYIQIGSRTENGDYVVAKSDCVQIEKKPIRKSISIDLKRIKDGNAVIRLYANESCDVLLMTECLEYSEIFLEEV